MDEDDHALEHVAGLGEIRRVPRVSLSVDIFQGDLAARLPVIRDEAVDGLILNLAAEADQVLQTAAEAIHRPSHNDIELPPGGIAAQRIERRAPISALGARYAVVPVDPDDLTAHAGGDLAQLALLIGRGLVDGGNAEIENGAAHKLGPPI